MPAPQHRHPLAAAELIVITCGSRKLDHPAPAGELYIGTYHRACRRAAEALQPRRLLILSSAYGLLGLDDIVESYDLAFGTAGSIGPEQLAAQARDLGLLDLDPVVVLAGGHHFRLAQSVWPHALNPLTGLGGMGRQISHLNTLAKELG